MPEAFPSFMVGKAEIYRRTTWVEKVIHPLEDNPKNSFFLTGNGN